MTPEEIIVRYRHTLELLVEATHWRFREMGRWRTLRVFWVLGSIGVCLIVAGLVVHRYQACASGAFLALFALIFSLGRSRIVHRQLRRQYHASNRQDLEIEWRFTESAVQIRDPHGSADLTWDSFLRCVLTPAGIMLYPHPHIFHWLPRPAFASEAEFVMLADTARRKIALYRELR